MSREPWVIACTFACLRSLLKNGFSLSVIGFVIAHNVLSHCLALIFWELWPRFHEFKIQNCLQLFFPVRNEYGKVQTGKSPKKTAENDSSILLQFKKGDLSQQGGSLFREGMCRKTVPYSRCGEFFKIICFNVKNGPPDKGADVSLARMTKTDWF